VIRWLYELLYGSTPAEFKSSVGLQESINRLRDATKRSAFLALSQQVAVGRVKETSVRLQRVIPMIHNSFKPFFIGRFEVRGDWVYLSGKFTMLLLVKIFMTIWLGIATTFAIAAVASNWSHNNSWPAFLGVFGFIGFGVAIIWVGKWFARNDVAWLSNVIRRALGAQATDQPIELGIQSGSMTTPASGPPTVLRVVSGVLLLAAIVSFTAVFSETESFNWGPKSAATSRLKAWAPPLLAGLQGILLFGLAVGIYRRKLLAWRVGLAYLGATWCLMVFQMFNDDGFSGLPDNTAVKVGFSAVSLLVATVWGRWWYAQRVHFAAE